MGPGEWAIGLGGRPRPDAAARRPGRDVQLHADPHALLLTATPEVWLKVPYRTQLDGSAYAEANCGPTSVAMALDAIGKRDTLESLRASALKLQDINGCDDCGTYIQHLASVADARGAKTYGLRDDPETFHRWTLDEVRQQLRQERVVIPAGEVPLPARPHEVASTPAITTSCIVGLAGTSFIYNDPVDSDGRGYGRLISAEAAGTGDGERDRRVRAGSVRGRRANERLRSQKSAFRRGAGTSLLVRSVNSQRRPY